jgi:hypothetical protein
MNLINNGSIVINDNKFKYKIFDTDGLIDIIRHNKKFCNIFLDAIRKYRNTPYFFDIFQLVREYITYRPDSELVYFVIYKNDEILGVFKNKLKVCSLATNQYIALIDSDNFCDETYFITAKNYILQNEDKFSKHIILSPSFAKPRFNYKHFENSVITKYNLKNYYHVHMFDVLLNTGNYLINKNIIDKITYDNSIMQKISACDVIFFNLLCFQQFEDFQLHIIKDFEYDHVVHDGSTYINTIHDCQEYRDSVVTPSYYQLMNDN